MADYCFKNEYRGYGNNFQGPHQYVRGPDVQRYLPPPEELTFGQKLQWAESYLHNPLKVASYYCQFCLKEKVPYDDRLESQG